MPNFVTRTRFDLTMTSLMVIYLVAFMLLAIGMGHTPETGIIRGFGSLAFLMLSFTLSIGPLARFSPAFQNIIYNRRHLGVTTFFIGLIHGAFSLIQFFEGDLVGIFTTNSSFTDLRRFPFVPFGFLSLVILAIMASTSHDWWFNKLGIRRWKSLHMLVYVAYASLVIHVGFGVLQDQQNFLMWLGFFAVVAFVVGAHFAAALKERRIDNNVGKREDGFIYACQLSDIPENRAKSVSLGQERVAVIHYEGEAYALTNVCPHQNGPLGEGKVVNGFLECPWHGFQFSPEEGKGPPPYCDRVTTYPVRVDGDRVFVNPIPNEIQKEGMQS